MKNKIKKGFLGFLIIILLFLIPIKLTLAEGSINIYGIQIMDGIFLTGIPQGNYYADFSGGSSASGGSPPATTPPASQDTPGGSSASGGSPPATTPPASQDTPGGSDNGGGDASDSGSDDEWEPPTLTQEDLDRISEYFDEITEEIQDSLRQEAFQDYVRNDFLRGLLFPSSTAQAVGRFLGNSIGWDTNKNLRTLVGGDAGDTLYSLAYPDEYKRVYCQEKLDESNYFTPGPSTPFMGLPEVKFIYGLYKDYSEYGLIYNNKLIKYLYTFTYHIDHPVSESEFSDMSYSEKIELGLDTTDGRLGIRLYFNPGQHYTQNIRVLKPGETLSGTFSVYLDNEINLLESVYFAFIDLSDENIIGYFPDHRSCNDDKIIGCIFELDEILQENYGPNLPYGESIQFTEEEGQGYDNNGIPIYGGVSGTQQTQGSGVFNW